MKTRLQIYGRGDYSTKHGDFAREVNTIGTRRMLVGTHRGGELPARPARWVLGKTGDTGTQDFDLLFDGQDSSATNSEIGGFSLEFSAERSVSALWTEGDDRTRKEIEEAFDASMHVGLRHAVDHIFVTDVSGKCERVDGVHAINYFHTMKSMDPYPALHQHILINNYGHTADGKIAAIDAAYFQDHLDQLGEIVGKEFREQLSNRLAVEWKVESGAYEIAGVSSATE